MIQTGCMLLKKVMYKIFMTDHFEIILTLNCWKPHWMYIEWPRRKKQTNCWSTLSSSDSICGENGIVDGSDRDSYNLDGLLFCCSGFQPLQSPVTTLKAQCVFFKFERWYTLIMKIRLLENSEIRNFVFFFLNILSCSGMIYFLPLVFCEFWCG